MEDKHEHSAAERSERRIAGGGSIAIETCACNAMRSVITRFGRQILSAWEEEEPGDEEEMPLVWDGETDNDNDNDPEG